MRECTKGKVKVGLMLHKAGFTTSVISACGFEVVPEGGCDDIWYRNMQEMVTRLLSPTWYVFRHSSFGYNVYHIKVHPMTCRGLCKYRGEAEVYLLHICGQHHAPAALPSWKNRYPLYRRFGGLQGRSGQHGKFQPYRDSIPRLNLLAAITYQGPEYVFVP